MRKRKILLVDDVELFLSLEKTFLHLDEFELITVHSGEKALAVTRAIAFDLIFLNLHMLGMNAV